MMLTEVEGLRYKQFGRSLPADATGYARAGFRQSGRVGRIEAAWPAWVVANQAGADGCGTGFNYTSVCPGLSGGQTVAAIVESVFVGRPVGITARHRGNE